jgi:hypothetical protein
VVPVESKLLSQDKVVDLVPASPQLTKEFVGGGLPQGVGHEHKAA